MIDKLKQAGQILDAKVPADAPAFKAWFKGVAEQVAEAASEEVSSAWRDEKKATIAEVSKALNVT